MLRDGEHLVQADFLPIRWQSPALGIWFEKTEEAIKVFFPDQTPFETWTEAQLEVERAKLLLERTQQKYEAAQLAIDRERQRAEAAEAELERLRQQSRSKEGDFGSLPATNYPPPLITLSFESASSEARCSADFLFLPSPTPSTFCPTLA
jgi:hypothetical protein